MLHPVPYRWAPWVFKPGKGWFETRAMFPGARLTHGTPSEGGRPVEAATVTHSTPSEGGQPAEAATEQLGSGTYSHVHIPSLLQKHRKTCSRWTLGQWFQQRHATLQLWWEKSAGTAASDEASAGKWSGQTTSAHENSPRDVGVMFRAQPQPLPSLPARPWTTLMCPISPSAEKEHDILFLPSLPVFSVCHEGLSSSPWHTQQPMQHSIDGATAEMERLTVCHSPTALTWLVPISRGQTHQNPVLYSSHLCYGLIWNERSSLSDLTQITNKAALADSA